MKNRKHAEETFRAICKAHGMDELLINSLLKLMEAAR